MNEAESVDPWSWLADLARTANAGGSGPRPGCLHVSSLRGGGHTGRGHTFIVGLDDTRFPGGGMQDPLLLDAERASLSDELVTSDDRLDNKVDGMTRLLARLRGEVSLSYCARSLADDRSLFPSSAFMTAYRAVSGNKDGDHESLLDWLPAPVAFAPLSPDVAVDSSEWWLAQTCGERALKNPSRVITTSFPHLAHGQIAVKARQSDLFTEYDGYVPDAAAKCNPFVKGARALSASRLEKLGQCPLDYFFQNVLGISSPEDHCPDPSQWLDPMSRGSLLHDVFREFMYRLCRDDLIPEVERDTPLLTDVLHQEIAAYRADAPPPSEEVFAAEVKEIDQIARIFLIEEERFCKEHIPRYFEVAIGLDSDREGTPLDTQESVHISLPGGKRILAHGRIDRVDEIAGSKGKLFTLWDYKTGSAWKFRQGDKVHWQGRVIQNILYVELVRKRLKKFHPGAQIQSFGYFFPSLREHGERISWTAAELEPGKQRIAWLCELLASGCFPDTDNEKDLNYSDYKLAHGDIDTATRAISNKLDNPANEMLSPYAKLRDIGWEDDNG
ncbi:MAG: PD-(D/E)XK nuclease family protein [bacterium]|nr:PD-(D/E)XK nuclease family protein [bacterium]